MLEICEYFDLEGLNEFNETKQQHINKRMEEFLEDNVLENDMMCVCPKGYSGKMCEIS